MPSSFDISQKCPIWLRALVPIKIWHKLSNFAHFTKWNYSVQMFPDWHNWNCNTTMLFIKRASSKLANQSTVCLIKWFKAKNEVYFKSSYFEEYLVIVRSLILDRFIDDILKIPQSNNWFQIKYGRMMS